ncbi:hypothetical protein SPSIL_030760 [Sporomusa silvacetica DSM 10669]|uniref:Uncharacterized protein n=1 Tax=Sporomusa silvacetica DSM 10669 TaxID=1123289 RepID=A0ABZ3INA1_9FIRM|nr:hypothetical protein [Sporomusa silvacetica]OZC23156.1 hypothetical protein SPSIL_03020 [Sporomusa silvacetica DSM 10669]
MNVLGSSSLTNNQIVRGQVESNSTQNGDSNSTGWRYISVKEGDTVYTYIVIGKNMKVLIGKTSTPKDDGKDKKTADDKQDATNNSNTANTACQNDSSKIKDEKISFLTDYRMLALTAAYQKKLRETMKNLEANIGCDK